jgi:hypothetical protein
MNRFLTIATIAAALLTPCAASAADTTGHAMMGTGTMMATLVCRPAQKDEKPNAMTTANAPLVCKSMAPMMHDGKMMGPAMPAGATGEKVDAAWQNWINSTFAIPLAGSP